MGNFYTNYTLRGPSQQSVAALLAGHPAIVTPEQDGCVVVFDEESEDQNQEVIATFASRLSGELCCPLLAVLNHDDDILWYQLYLNGELADEYNSSPNYFDDSDGEETSAPAGGNAGKLCQAFGSGTAGQIEGILRKSSSDDDGYTFAVERHEDLAGVLGIPSFGVGTGFRGVSQGELPEGLGKNDLLLTKDLITAQSNSQLSGGIRQKPVPGYYKVNPKPADSSRRFNKSAPAAWMPSTWTELACSERDLSTVFYQATAAYRGQFKQLGFAELGFKRLTRILNPNNRESGGINYLDRSRCHFGQLIYNRSYFASSNIEKEQIVISFTALFQGEMLSCSNEISTPFEPLPNHKVFRIQSNDTAFIYQNFLQQLKERAGKPHCFTDLQLLQTWFDSNALEVFESRVQQGWFIQMSDYEIKVARRKLPPTLPNT